MPVAAHRRRAVVPASGVRIARWHGLGAVIAVAALVAGCTSSDGSAGSVTGESIAGDAAAPADTGPDFVRNSGETSSGGEAGAGIDGGGVGEETPASTTIAPVPDTGVPGIDSDDVFCRSWSEFAGSFQALGLVSAFGEPVGAIRLEVIAAAAVVDAAARLEANLPDALDSERAALLDDFAGPFVRRAERAVIELANADVDRADELRTIWLDQLASSGVDDPEMSVTLPDAIDAGAVDEAVDAFAAALPPIVEDPSLITGATIPLTEAYLAANCPDQGILSGNDVITSS